MNAYFDKLTKMSFSHKTIRPLAENSHFRSNIIDFEGDRNSVFLKARNSNWLPMVLVFKVDGIYECMYLVVSR